MLKADILTGSDYAGYFCGQARGSYVLLISLSENRIMTIGSLSDINFSSGFYAYVGSALSGIAARLRHHLKKGKSLHWHIDYLLEEANIIDIGVCETRDRSECLIASVLGSQFDSIPGFGSSDCRCRSHLFFDKDEERMRDRIKAAISSCVLIEAGQGRICED